MHGTLSCALKNEISSTSLTPLTKGEVSLSEGLLFQGRIGRRDPYLRCRQTTGIKSQGPTSPFALDFEKGDGVCYLANCVSSVKRGRGFVLRPVEPPVFPKNFHYPKGYRIAMQVTAEQVDPCTLSLDIVVDEEQVAKTFDKTYREFSRVVNVPGFRPGKAPRAILERHVNKQRLQERAREVIIQEAYGRALEQEGVTPYRNATVQPSDLEDKKPFAFKAIVPLEPQVKLGEYTGITVDKPIYPVTDEMVDSRVQQLREERARLERITDRGVEAGDVLIAEMQTVIEGVEESSPARRQLIQMGSNVPGFDEQVMGMNPGDERSFELRFPDDFEEEEKRGKNATYTVKLSSISGRKVPELNDDFAKQLEVETVEDLQKQIREALETEASELSNQVAEQRIIEKVLESSEVYFPEALVQEEMEDDFKRLSAELKQYQMPYEQFLAQIGMSGEEHYRQVHDAAATRIRSVLALRQVAIQEGLQVTDEAIDVEFANLVTLGRITEEQFEDYRGEGRRRLQVANALVQQQLHDFLFEKNSFNEVEEDINAVTQEDETEAPATLESAASPKGMSESAVSEDKAEAEPTAPAENSTPEPEAAPETRAEEADAEKTSE